MQGSNTTKLLKRLEIKRDPMLYLSKDFKITEDSYHNSEKVEFDVRKNNERISVPVTSISDSGRVTKEDKFVVKEFTPPIHLESDVIHAGDFMKRQFGKSMFEDQGFLAQAAVKAIDRVSEMESAIIRSYELQAAQIRQTGKVTLVDKQGNNVYTIDFLPEATLFPTAATAWSQNDAPIIDDLSKLAEEIYDKGLKIPNRLDFGIESYDAFKANEQVRKELELDRLDSGKISPMTDASSNGGLYRGTIDIGNFKFDIYTYRGRYDDPQTGLKTQYLDPKKVLMRSDEGELQATFGDIPVFPTPQNSLLQLPKRVKSGIDLHINTWFSDSGKELNVEVGSRPLLIPRDMNSFGCIDTGIA